MSGFLQQVLSGAASGLVYAGLALALCVVYQGTGVLNFAQGEMATLSAFLAWTLLGEGLSFALVLPLVVVASFVLGATVERVLIRPVEQASEISILVVTLGVYFLVNGLTGAIWGHTTKTLASPFGEGTHDVLGAVVTSQQIGMAAVLAVVLLIVKLVFDYTDLGLRLRAAAYNPTSSRLLGVSVGRTLALGWGIAAAVGGVAAVMAAPVTGIDPNTASATILIAFAAAAFGGFTSRAGAVVGGVTIGILMNVSGAYVPGLDGGLALVVPFALIVMVLLFRPQGLFGAKAVGRV